MKKKCWNCGKETCNSDFFCKYCGKIQETEIENEFELFGIKESVIISLEKLEESYLGLQAKFHPDKFINLSEKEIDISTIYSSKINEIYSKLKSNVSRISLMLKNLGYENLNENNSFDDPDTLNEIMEINEEYMFSHDLAKKREIKEKIIEMIKKILLDIQEMFENKEFDKISKNNIKLSYLEKIIKK